MKEGTGRREGGPEEEEKRKLDFLQKYPWAFIKPLQSLNHPSTGIFSVPGTARGACVTCDPRGNPVT